MDRNPRIDIACELEDPEFVKIYGAELAKSEFAVALSRARVMSDITQKELADKMRLKQPYIAKLEGGDANPTLSTVGRLLAVQGFRVIMRVEPLIPEPASFPSLPGTAAMAYDVTMEGFNSADSLLSPCA